MHWDDNVETVALISDRRSKLLEVPVNRFAALGVCSVMKLESQRRSAQFVVLMIAAVVITGAAGRPVSAGPLDAESPVGTAQSQCAELRHVFIFGQVWDDTAAPDSMFGSDPTVAGHAVRIEDADTGDVYASTSTDSTGFYGMCLSDPQVSRRAVVVSMDAPPSFQFVDPGVGDEVADSDIEPSTSQSVPFTPASELDATSQFEFVAPTSIRLDAGVRKIEVVSPTVPPTVLPTTTEAEIQRQICFGPVNVVTFLDANADGDPAGEATTDNVLVELVGAGLSSTPPTPNQLTDINGRAQWSQVCAPLGAPTIAFQFSKPGAAFAIGQDGIAFGAFGDTSDSDVDAAGLTPSIPFPAGPLDVVAGIATDAPPRCTPEIAQTDPAADADGDGLQNADDDEPCTPLERPCQFELSGFVWTDTNGDGQRTPTEPLAPGTAVQLFSGGAQPFEVMQTDSGGMYTYSVPCPEGVEPGGALPAPITVVVVAPPGASFTVQDVGSDASDSDVAATGEYPTKLTNFGTYEVDAGLLGVVCPGRAEPPGDLDDDGVPDEIDEAPCEKLTCDGFVEGSRYRGFDAATLAAAASREPCGSVCGDALGDADGDGIPNWSDADIDGDGRNNLLDDDPCRKPARSSSRGLLVGGGAFAAAGLGALGSVKLRRLK